MKKRLIAIIMFCMVMFAGCSTSTDKDTDDVPQKVYQENSLEQSLQEVPEASVAMKEEAPASTSDETLQETQGVTAENNPYSADAQEIEEIVTEFYTAYFDGNLDSIKPFLTDQYIWDMDVYGNSADKVEVTAVKGLEDIGEMKIDDVCVVSVEYKEDGMDTYVYLTVEFIKTDKGWKIEFYGSDG